MKIIVVDGVACPAGHTEVDPETAHLPILERKIQIRAFKVHLGDSRGWMSECLICKRWFDEQGNWE